MDILCECTSMGYEINIIIIIIFLFVFPRASKYFTTTIREWSPPRTIITILYVRGRLQNANIIRRVYTRVAAAATVFTPGQHFIICPLNRAQLYRSACTRGVLPVNDIWGLCWRSPQRLLLLGGYGELYTGWLFCRQPSAVRRF